MDEYTAVLMSLESYNSLKKAWGGDDFEQYQKLPIIIDNSLPIGTCLKIYENEVKEWNQQQHT